MGRTAAMRGPRKVSVVGRREFLIGASAAAAFLALPAEVWAADPPNAAPPSLLDQALDKILGEAKPQPGKIALELPEIAENGNTVPYTIVVESPMTQADHVRAVHVLATVNPLPRVASFNFSLLSGRAMVSSRMRLAKSQDVMILAEMSSGRFILARRTVKVTIGGCGD